ncbi:hypothetical protein E4U21_001082 [Claviceps maximensis]|nr:hypothetical protein E4U21_001082 [Claviceps maximensis]
MAPIPVYSSSPINAAKPSGVTSKTATLPGADKGGQDQAQGRYQPETSTAASSEPCPLAAQPGALPSLPKQTATPFANNVSPTPTQGSSVLSENPPPPQPGAFPALPGHSASNPNALPPPPRAGESVKDQQPAAPVTTLPPQMGYQPPQASLPIQGRSSTSTMAPFTAADTARPTSTSLQGQHPSASYSPPAGAYQQDVNAAGYNQYQRSTAAYEDQSEASVWDTAKKWAASAGEGLAAAENELWKRINKD